MPLSAIQAVCSALCGWRLRNPQALQRLLACIVGLVVLLSTFTTEAAAQSTGRFNTAGIGPHTTMTSTPDGGILVATTRNHVPVTKGCFITKLDSAGNAMDAPAVGQQLPRVENPRH